MPSLSDSCLPTMTRLVNVSRSVYVSQLTRSTTGPIGIDVYRTWRDCTLRYIASCIAHYFHKTPSQRYGLCY